MRTHGVEEANEHGDAEAAVRTGVRDQLLLVHGWSAGGTGEGGFGPHVRLRTSDDREAVLSTSQVPELIECLHQVADRVDRRWQAEGAQPGAEAGADSADRDRPAVLTGARRRELELFEQVSAHLSEVIALLTRSEDSQHACQSVARLLDVDETELLRLSRFSLLGLTRGARAARARELAALRAQR